MATRLASTTFHLALASDLERARTTALAILATNPTVEQLHLWPLARERNCGDFYGSGAGFRRRVVEFLERLQAEVLELEEDRPR